MPWTITFRNGPRKYDFRGVPDELGEALLRKLIPIVKAAEQAAEIAKAARALARAINPTDKRRT